MYFLAILFTLAAANPTPKPPPKYMHNIEYFLRGYNVLKGNPHQTSVSAIDPGFQEPIFRLSYDQGTITPDDKYFSPDGTLVTMCQACSIKPVTKKISGMNSYRDSLSEKVKISEEICIWWWCPYRFSWSVDYKKVQSGIFQYSNFYTHSDASCCVYQVQTDLYKPPPFSSDFLRGIISLPEDYTTDANKELYRKFIDSFGTNYIKQTDMGSLFGQEIKISKESWKDMLDQSINIDWSASLSMFFAWYVDADGKYHQEQKQVDKFKKLTSSRLLYTAGSKPPKDGSLTTWVNEAKEYPAQIALELGSILDLFTSLKVPQPIIANLNESLHNYCDDNTCKGLNPDQEFPRSWQDWLNNLTTGERSEAKYCKNGDYVTMIQIACDNEVSESLWSVGGLIDLCFKCATEDKPQCFNATDRWGTTYVGMKMQCSTNGFKSMTTYESQWYTTYPINVKAQCYDDNGVQAAFNVDSSATWVPWITCADGQKIVGFQVERYFWTPYPVFKGRIMNFRFECA